MHCSALLQKSLAVIDLQASTKSDLFQQREDSSDNKRIESISFFGGLRSHIVVGRLQQEGRQSNATHTTANGARADGNSRRQPKHHSTRPNNSTLMADHEFNRDHDRRLGHRACLRL
jgi:hypothetical protein